jgi:hypothetical protein
MVARVVAAALLVLLLSSAVAITQQQPSPVPLYPGASPRSVEPQALPPLEPAVDTVRPPDASPPAGPAAAMSAPTQRVFCEQPVTVELADREAVAERFRPFVGIWSDASWTPLLCAALIVENVAPDGTATILYVFGPMGSNARAAGGVLQGTGIIRDGELKFENSDGSQFAFRLIYADLDGHLATPKGQSYQASFKRTP